jgi:capsular exopolysaccharide synthesis family protein
MTLVDYVTTLRRSWRLLLVVTLLGGLVAYGYSSQKSPSYRATATVLVSADRASTQADLVQGSTFVENLVNSYSLMASSQLVLQPVIDELGIDQTPRQLARSLSVDTPLNTVAINISVVRGDAAQSAKIANAVADELAVAVAKVSPVVDDQPSVRVTTINPASEPRYPISPHKKRTTVLGLVIGLILAMAIALVRRILGGKVTDASDVALLTTVPTVGEIVEAKRRTTLPATVRQNPRSPQAESLRALAANLHYLSFDGGLRSLVITSPSPGEAKSNIATALSVILAEGAGRVLLVDADLRSPSVHSLTGLDNSVGLSSVLVGDTDLSSAVQHWGQTGLDVLTSGAVPPNPGQLLNSESLKAVLAEASSRYDLVIIDSGPLTLVSDAVWLGHLVDRVLVVAHSGRTKARALVEALDALASAGVPAAGVVVSRVRRRRSTYTYGSDYLPAGKQRRARARQAAVEAPTTSSASDAQDVRR